MKNLFKVGEKLPKKTILMIEVFGLLMFLLFWFLITIQSDKVSIQFDSSNPTDCKYTWTGPDGFKKEFTGDNAILNLKLGETYYFTAQNKKETLIKDSVVISDTLVNGSVSLNFSNKTDVDSLNIDIILKSEKDGWVRKAIIPPPGDVLRAFGKLHFDKDGKVRKNTVIVETGYSLSLNVLGYVEAIIVSIILGFLIGLIPFFRALLSRWVNAVRFVPLTAVTGLFVAWFGIDSNMKIQFLAFGIIVYLLPVVVQRIDEVKKIYLQTAYTLGATKWQLIKTVYFPSVASKIIDDVRVLTAISWTYIIIAEMLNQTGGIGSLIFLSGKQGQLDKVFALLIIIVLIGVIQDKLFAWLDKLIFKYKYQ